MRTSKAQSLSNAQTCVGSKQCNIIFHQMKTGMRVQKGYDSFAALTLTCPITLFKPKTVGELEDVCFQILR